MVGNRQTQNQNRKLTEKFGRDQKSGKVHVRYLWKFQVEEHVRLFFSQNLLGPVHLLGFRKLSTPCTYWVLPRFLEVQSIILWHLSLKSVSEIKKEK